MKAMDNMLRKLDEHYEVDRKQALQRLRGEVVRRFRHELSELVISLEQPEPNVATAKRRAEQMLQYLTRLEAREF